MLGTSRAFADPPLAFELNAGQADRSINFISHAPGHTLSTGPDTVVISSCAARNRARGSRPKECSPRAIQIRFLRVNHYAAVAGEKQLPGKSNYFIGSDSSRWLVDVPHFQQVRYRNIYSGIDLVYHGNRRNLEYDFVMRPYADPSVIAFTLDGGSNPGSSVRISRNGELEMQSASGTVYIQAPVAYQFKSGKQEFISVRYSKQGRNRIAFDLGSYDRSRELIIDPVLSYSSFLGGSSDDFGYAIAVDSAGNIYVAGGTTSADFPLSSGALQTTYGGADSNTQGVMGDVFVSKLDPTGKTLLYSTYVGGSADDNAYGIAVDSAGNAYVTGATNSFADFPVTNGALQTTPGGGPNDVFIFKLSPTGSALVYSTYLGTSTGGERGFGIAVDAAGDAYVTGDAAPDFPVTMGSYGGGVNDTEVTELNPTGSAKVLSTFFGGNGIDEGYGIAVDAAGNISITGLTTSTDLPVTANAVQAHIASTNDAFVAQFDKAGTLTYCSYLGGSADEFTSSLGAIAVDASGKIYVTGSTASADYPTSSGAFQTTYGGGGSDVFVTAIDPSKPNSLVYSTFLGGSGDDDKGEFARGIAIDAAGNAIITGSTNSANFPILRATQSSLAGGLDAFVTKLNSTGSALIYSTYLGGAGNDFGASVAVDQIGNAYVTGQTSSNDLPTASALQGTLNGPTDAFIARLSADFGLTSSPPSASISAGEAATYTISVSPSDGLYGAPVSLACSGLPSLSKCTISPQQVTPGSSAATAQVTISTTAPQFSTLRRVRNVTGIYALFVPLLLFSSGVLKRRWSAKRRIVGALFAVVLLSYAAFMVGCSSSSSQSQVLKGGTPSGTSTITITATSSSTSHTTTVTLNVM